MIGDNPESGHPLALRKERQMASNEPVLRTCVVCGAQSHRTDWINKVEGYVACDWHKGVEFAKAVATAKAPAPPAAPATPIKATPIPPKAN